VTKRSPRCPSCGVLVRPAGWGSARGVRRCRTTTPRRLPSASKAHDLRGARPPLQPPPDPDLAALASEPLLTKRGVSLVLGVSERTVDRLVAAGRIRAYRIGGHRRFRLDDLEAFITASEERT
jgi:excisionase family DNA binding protein